MRESSRPVSLQPISEVLRWHQEERLILRPAFQRNSVWTRSAQQAFIDTLLRNKPIPLIFLQRSFSAQRAHEVFSVVDGQQRLTAILDFLNDGFAVVAPRSKGPKLYSQLSPERQRALVGYELVVEELTGYSNADVIDIFERLNRYSVRLSGQELRNARAKGAFAKFVSELGELPFWDAHRVFSARETRRMRSVEFAAELTILLIEGPQDKKSRIDDFYFGDFIKSFPEGASVRQHLTAYLGWIEEALPQLRELQFRKPVDLYALIGALDRLSKHGRILRSFSKERGGSALREFGSRLKRKQPDRIASAYLLAASRQTDNVIPRTTRIEILERLLSGARV